MNKSKLRSILMHYVILIRNEQGLTTTQYSDKQWKIMAEKLEQFSSNCKDDTTLLLFFYSWYNIKNDNPKQTLIDTKELVWENVFKDGNISKEQYEQMLQSWASLEKNIIQFTQENQKLLEKSKNKQQNNDLETEL